MMQHMRDRLKFNEGLEIGLEKGIEMVIEMACNLNMPEEEIVNQLMEKFELTREKAMEYMKATKVQRYTLEIVGF